MRERSRPVIYAPRALDDREDIELAGIEMWGDERTAAYIVSIDVACEEIGRYPEIGRARDDLRPGLRGFPVEQHVVYYRIRANDVRISRILHARRDASAVAGL